MLSGINLTSISDINLMEKEFDGFIQLENQVEKMIDLVAKLKEDNRKLQEENELLQNKVQFINSDISPQSAISDDNIDSSNIKEKALEENEQIIRTRIKNALLQLDQLHQYVINDKNKIYGG